MESTLFVQDQHLFFLAQAIGSYVLIINANSEQCKENGMMFWWCKRFNTCETHAFILSTHFFLSILRLNGVAILMSHLLCSARCVNIQIPMQIRPKFVTDRMVRVCVCLKLKWTKGKKNVFVCIDKLVPSCQFTLVIV